MKLFADHLATLERALDVRGDRHTVLAGNLANADTPAFAPKDLDFDAEMARALGPDGDAGGDNATSTLHDSEALAGLPGLDGNSVDNDKTMAALADNGMQYSAAARAASKKLAILRYVANDGVG